MSKQADKLFFWLIMVVIFLVITSLSYFTFLSEKPTPTIVTTPIKKENPVPVKKKIQEPKKTTTIKKEEKKKEEKKKEDQEKIPPPNNPPQTTHETYPEINEPVGGIENLLEGLFHRINNRAQMQYGQMLIDDFNLLDGGMHLEVKTTTLWSLLPRNYKLQVLQVLANQYTLIACNVTRIINCSPNNIPSTSVIDPTTGQEVASYSSSQGPQIFE